MDLITKDAAEVATQDSITLLDRVKGYAVVGVPAAVGVALVLPNGASAAGDNLIDYSGITNGITGNLTAAAAVAVGIIALVTGALMGYRFLKKLGAAKSV
jgi:hypothetical protein